MTYPIVPGADYRQVLLRLTAAWALSEGLLGGVLHAFKIPFTGLVVGSSAVICLTLIGYFRQSRGEILKATLIVVIIKALLSPHAPLPAYFAVLFQGITAELLFRGNGNHRLKCVVLAVLALVESSVQKIIILTLLFGKGIWEAVDGFLESLLKQFASVPASYSLILAGCYVGLHFIVGILVGNWAGKLPKAIAENPNAEVLQPVLTEQLSSAETTISKPKRKGWKKYSWLVIWAILLLILVQHSVGFGPQWLPKNEALELLLRSAILLLGWYFIVGPVLLRLFKNWLQQQREKRLAAEVEAVLNLLPETKTLLQHCWQASAGVRGFTRWQRFLKLAATQLVSPLA